MRLPRVKPAGAVFHCISRIVGGQLLLNTEEKEVFRKQMRKLAQFCGIEVITYCILNGHFHILCRAPATIELTDQQLFERVTHRYGENSAQALALKECLQVQGCLSPELRERYLRRMGDVSQFMKELKQGFSIWYNHKHDRFGTLWAERFSSLVIEPCERDLISVAAYVDLNAVRAGLVEDPKDYRFCGYAEALAQNGAARAGLRRILPGENWEEQAAAYRMELFGRGGFSRSLGKKVIDREAILKVMRAGGKLERHELLRLRVRYFSQGVAIGSRDYVERLFEKYRRKYFPKAREVARAVPGMDCWIMRLRNRKVPGFG